MRRITLFTLLLFTATLNCALAATSSTRMSVQPKGTAALASDTTPPAISIISPKLEQGVKLVANDASLTVTGRTTDLSGVSSVTVNGQSATLDENGGFTVELLLKPGDNQITVAATDIYRNSASAQFIVTNTRIAFKPKAQISSKKDTTPPTIEITSPQTTRGVKLVAKEQSITVTGTAIDTSGVSSVTVNGLPAELDENGNFSAELLLKPGENLVMVEAIDVFWNSASEKFSVSRKSEQAPAKSKQEKLYLASDGSYHALIIGINDYQSLAPLKTAVNDAQEVDKMLKNEFGFQTKLLLNGERDSIMKELNELRKRVKENDSVLIYYAGHGEYDRSSGKAFWLPVNAKRDDDTDWIIVDNITASIRRLPAKHIMIVSDSCYSGTLTRGSHTQLNHGERSAYLQKVQERPSRTLMASGGNEPVADSGGSGHSIFADSFMKALREIEEPVFSADELFFKHVKSRVAGKSDQLPEYNEIRNSGHDGGDFVFKRKN